MNRTIKISIFLIGLLVSAGFCFYFGVYNRSYIDMETVTAEIKISSEQLVSSFIANEKSANSSYKGKIVEVEGIVREVTFLNNRNTVLLYGNNKYSGVICDMQSGQIEKIKALMPGQKIKIKGICKGFLKDAILLNCMLINTQIDE